MKWGSGFLNARSYLVFLSAMIFCFVLVFALDAWQPAAPAANAMWPPDTAGIPRARGGNLQASDEQAAQIAWKYFENNYQPKTGLVNSADLYPATTMWDTGSYFMALISAHRLGFVGDEEFHRRLSLGLKSLATLSLFDGELPNKSYNTLTLQMVDYNNHTTARGIGWSAIDLGRLMVPFNIVVWHYPEHAAEVRAVLEHWKLNHLTQKGQLFGAAVDEAGKTLYLQEGRLGYEQYSAKSYSLIGLDVGTAQHYANFLRYVKIYGLKVPTDSRTAEKYHAHNYVVSESYILDGLEFGWDGYSKELAYRVYEAQEERRKRTGILTAVSEDNIDQAPYFVYNTVFTNGKAWNTITDKGEDASAFKSLSTKAVFGWYALYATDYTDELRKAVETSYDPQRGWYAGVYENTGKPNRAITANTNAVILESLCFRKFGRLVEIQ
jgi:hypothetical protein